MALELPNQSTDRELKMSVVETSINKPFRPALRLLFALAASLAWSSAARGQSSQPETPPQSAQPPKASIRLESISLFTGYYSNGFDPGTTQVVNPTALGADVIVGSSAVVKWDRPTERSDLFVTYVTDYSGHVRYTDWQNLNHHFSFVFSRKLARWDLRFSAAAATTNTEQTLFEPNTLSNVAAVPSTFGELTTGIMLGASSNRALAPLLSGAQAVASPTLLLYGARTLTTSAEFGVTNHLSALTTISFSFGATRNQSLPLSDAAIAAGATPFLGSDTTGNVAVSVSHSLSPRTQVSFSFGSSRTISRLEDAYYNTGSFAITRTLTEHWFASMHAGGGNVQPVRQTLTPPTGPQYLAGGSLGYKIFSHTFLASYERTFADSYGIGAASAMSTTGAWNWARTGGTWRLRASLSQEQMESNAFATLDTWQATVSLRKILSPHAAITAEYGYMRYSGGPAALNTTLSPSAVRLIVSWAPALGLMP